MTEPPRQESRFAEANWQGPFVHYGGAQGPLTLTCDLVVVDVETTGFDPTAGDRLLEVSAIRVNPQGQICDEFTTLVDAQVSDTGAEHIHGISPDMLDGAPTFSEIFPVLKSLFSGAIFVAHHAKFDESFLANEAKRAGFDFPRMPGLCTYVLARDTLNDVPNHKLATLVSHFGLARPMEHYAYHDARSVVDMLPNILPLAGDIGHFLDATEYVSTTDIVRTKIR